MKFSIIVALSILACLAIESVHCKEDEASLLRLQRNQSQNADSHRQLRSRDQEDELLREMFSLDNKISASDYVFNLDGAEDGGPGDGGRIKVANKKNWEILADKGVAYSLFEIEPCGINLPHHHPRATELLYIIDAANLTVGFEGENGGVGTVINRGLKTGYTTVFPMGSIHYQQNFACTPAKYISALNSDDGGGVVTTINHFQNLPIEALQASFDLTASDIRSVFQRIPAGPNNGLFNTECAMRCGLIKK